VEGWGVGSSVWMWVVIKKQQLRKGMEVGFAGVTCDLKVTRDP